MATSAETIYDLAFYTQSIRTPVYTDTGTAICSDVPPDQLKKYIAGTAVGLDMLLHPEDFDGKTNLYYQAVDAKRHSIKASEAIFSGLPEKPEDEDYSRRRDLLATVIKRRQELARGARKIAFAFGAIVGASVIGGGFMVEQYVAHPISIPQGDQHTKQELIGLPSLSNSELEAAGFGVLMVVLTGGMASTYYLTDEIAGKQVKERARVSMDKSKKKDTLQ